MFFISYFLGMVLDGGARPRPPLSAHCWHQENP